MAEKISWALTQTFDLRLIDTQWEVPNVPPFSQHSAAWVPSKKRFLARALATCTVSFLLLDAIGLAAERGSVEQNQILFAQERVGFLRRLQYVRWQEEVALRFVSAGMFYVVTFLLYLGVYAAVGAVMVGLGLSKVRRWRSIFGRVGDAWSVRRFWG